MRISFGLGSPRSTLAVHARFRPNRNRALQLVLIRGRAAGASLPIQLPLAADVVLLAGDTFESHRLPPDLIERSAAVIAAAGIPVVLLPGNHDPAIPEAVYHHGALAGLDHLHVLGVTHDEAIVFPQLDLEIFGRAHRDYGDMIPLHPIRPRRTRWQIAVAHG